MSGEDAVRVLSDYSYFLNYAKKKASLEDAEDAVQEAFLELVKRPSLNYNYPKTAMTTIVHNEIADLHKKRKRAHREESHLDQIVMPESDDNRLRGLIFSLRREVDELPKNYRCVVSDRLNGLGYNEICAKYGISAASARTRFSRACLFLKEKLVAYDLEKSKETPLKILESSVA